MVFNSNPTLCALHNFVSFLFSYISYREKDRCQALERLPNHIFLLILLLKEIIWNEGDNLSYVSVVFLLLLVKLVNLIVRANLIRNRKLHVQGTWQIRVWIPDFTRVGVPMTS